MKRLLAIIFLAVVLYGAWWFFLKKDAPGQKRSAETTKVKVNKHSEEFNQRISNAVNNYLSMKSAFVDADTIKIKLNGQKLIASIDSVRLNDLQKDDSTILLTAQQEVSDIKANADAMLQENALIEMREDFRMVSEKLYDFLRTINYEGPKLYWQNCPMAFGENKEGNWLSDTSEIINPYLGKNSSGDKSTMPACGETKDSLK